MFNFNNTYNYDSTDTTMDFDTLQKARHDLIGELQAVIAYDEHIRSTNDKTAKATWNSIKNEELVHVGELLGLLNYLDPSQKQFIQKGLVEFSTKLKQ